MTPFDVEKTAAFRLAEGDAVKERLIESTRIAAAFYPQQIVDVFVSETRDETNRQLVQSLWFFTQSLTGEFKNPMTELNFDVARLGEIRFVALQASEFDVVGGKFSEKSRLTAYVYFEPDVAGVLKASGENCTELLRIVRGRLLPRFG